MAKFDANNVQVLIEGKDPVLAYDNTFKGERYFHIRKCWYDRGGELQPGKGLAVPYDQKDQLIRAISGLNRLKAVG